MNNGVGECETIEAGDVGGLNEALTRSEGQWEPYTALTWLNPGDTIRFIHPLAGHSFGIFKKELRVNVSCTIGGRPYKVRKTAIESYRRGSISNLPETVVLPPKKMANVTKSSEAFYRECTIGDVVLFYRGRQCFDVATVTDFRPGNKADVKVTLVNGKDYLYKSEWYVQKLDGERIKG